eukprot:gene2362-3092_t
MQTRKQCTESLKQDSLSLRNCKPSLSAIASPSRVGNEVTEASDLLLETFRDALQRNFAKVTESYDCVISRTSTFTPAQLVNFVFIANETDHDDPALYDAVATQLELHGALGPLQVSDLLVLLQVYRDIRPALHDAVVCEMEQRMPSITSPELAQLALSCKRNEVSPLELFEKLVTQVARLISTMDKDNLSKLMYSCVKAPAAARVMEPHSSRILQIIAEHLAENLQEYNTMDLGEFWCWFVRAGYSDENTRMLKHHVRGSRLSWAYHEAGHALVVKSLLPSTLTWAQVVKLIRAEPESISANPDDEDENGVTAGKVVLTRWGAQKTLDKFHADQDLLSLIDAAHRLSPDLGDLVNSFVTQAVILHAGNAGVFVAHRRLGLHDAEEGDMQAELTGDDGESANGIYASLVHLCKRVKLTSPVLELEGVTQELWKILMGSPQPPRFHMLKQSLHQTAIRLLDSQWEQLGLLGSELMAVEQLTGKELDALFAGIYRRSIANKKSSAAMKRKQKEHLSILWERCMPTCTCPPNEDGEGSPCLVAGLQRCPICEDIKKQKCRKAECKRRLAAPQ